MSIFEYSKKTEKEIFSELGSSFDGLSENEALKRLEKFGKNEVITKKITAFEIFLRQFKSPLIYLLFIAVIISLFLKEINDAIIILIILLINSFLGFYQEYRSEKILEKLKKFLVNKAKVRRDGKIKIIDRNLLVKGDIVILEEGDIVPADLRVLKVNNFSVDEEILTGESVPVRKTSEVQEEKINQIYEAKNLVFAGTLVVGGSSEGIVIATGKESTMGEIVKLITETKRKSIFEENTEKLSKFILKVVLVTLLIIFIINLFLKKGTIDFSKLLLFNIALAVSVVPEALPLIVTLTLSGGAYKMAKKGVVVKRLSSVQDLASVDILCTDKTGTITENILEIKEIYPAENQKKWLLFALLASEYLEGKEVVFEPFDKAIYQKSSSEIRNDILNYKRIWNIPFDPNRRRNLVVVKNENKTLLIIRGAPEEIINLANKIFINGSINDFSNENKNKELEKISKIGQLGYRVLAVGYKEIEEKESYSFDDEKDIIYLGFASFIDPLKPTAKSAIIEAEKLGLKIKILTGDSKEVAETVAKEIGLVKTGQKVFTGNELDQMSEKEFSKAIEKGVVFARVSPVQKYKIIEKLKEKYSVAFLGEGINDAPALKITDVGMVVDSAADVSKEVADIVLLKRDLKVITECINEGRKALTNTLKYIKYTLIGNFGNFYTMATISLFIQFLPMLPVQILLLNLLSDLPLVSVVTDKVDYKEIDKPQKYDFHELTNVCIFLGLVSTVFDFIFFAVFFPLGEELLRTLWFVASVLTELAIIYSIRTKFFFLKGGLPSLPLMIISLLAFLITILVSFTNLGSIFHFVSPPISNLFIIIILVILYFFTTEFVKLIYYHKKIKALI